MRRPITAQTRIAGVVGHPARHSLSPVIHNAWIEAAALDAVYLAFEPPVERFEAFIEGLRGRCVNGLNVTTPFKERAFALATESDPASAFIQAANVLAFAEDGAIAATSTDGEGLLAALEAAGVDFRLGPVVVLGAGGAARSIGHALRWGGAGEIRVVNRTLDRAQALIDLDPDRTFAYAWSDAAKAVDGASAIINATSLGMKGQPPLTLDLDPAPLTAVVADIVYHPLVTPLLDQARRRGRRTVDGLAMLIGQAAPSFEAFFGRPPPDLDVRALCEAALRDRP